MTRLRDLRRKPNDMPPPDPDDIDDDDDDDEDLVAYTASEAAGAFATLWRFTWPHLRNYRTWLSFVAIGLFIETLFNVIMPLSLKFLIDDALGEEDFRRFTPFWGAGGRGYHHVHRRGLVRALGCAAGGGDFRCPVPAVRACPEFAGGVLRAHQARRNPVAVLRRHGGL
jgi:hypothetical protein